MDGLTGGPYFQRLIRALYLYRKVNVFENKVRQGVDDGHLDHRIIQEIAPHKLAVSPYETWNVNLLNLPLVTFRQTLRSMDLLSQREADGFIGRKNIFKDAKFNLSHEDAIAVAAAFDTSYAAVRGDKTTRDIPWFYLASNLNYNDTNLLAYGSYQLAGSICGGVAIRWMRGWVEISLVTDYYPLGFSYRHELMELQQRFNIADKGPKIWFTSKPIACRVHLQTHHLLVPLYKPELEYILVRLLRTNVTHVRIGDLSWDIPWTCPISINRAISEQYMVPTH